MYMCGSELELSYTRGKIGKVLAPKVKEQKKEKNVLAPSFVRVRILCFLLFIER
jgi:hypothetical protein